MSDKKLWRDSLEKSEATFSEQDSTKESKKRMYYSIMNEAFPDSVEVSYAQAMQKTQDLSDANVKTKSAFRPKLATAGFVGALAAALIITVVNTRNLDSQLGIFPPLKQQDFPTALSDTDSEFLTVSTNNNFYLGYAKSTEHNGTLDVLVHSRSADISWETFSAEDLDDMAVQPISIDSEKNIISLPATETDIYISIDDENGNSIECIIPKEM